MRARRERDGGACARLAIVVCVGLIGVVRAGAANAADAYQPKRVTRDVVAVVAEVSGDHVVSRVADARVRVYALTRHGDGWRKRRIGSARTGSRGVALVRLSKRHAPRRLRVEVSDGTVAGQPFRGTMVLQDLDYAAPHAVYVTPVSTLVAADQQLHRRRSIAASTERALRALGLPATFDPALDMAFFDGQPFADAAARGELRRFVRSLVRTMNDAAPAQRALAAAETGGLAACWEQVAQTTAGFAQFLGFLDVPSPPARPSACPARSASIGVRPAGAVGIGLGVVGDLIGAAGLMYSIFSGQGTASQLEQIETSLDQIQSQLTAIQAQLGGLATAVAQVGADVTEGNITSLAGDADPTITAIKIAGKDVDALLGGLYQIVCDPTNGCATLGDYDDLTAALAALCPRQGASKQCDDFFTLLGSTRSALADSKPADAMANLAEWALGSAGGGPPATPGIVQYALQAGPNGAPFFQTASAAYARLQWAYYTLYSAWAQTTYALTMSMSIGQREPGTSLKHPVYLAASDVQAAIAPLDATMDLFMGAFPNMPDTAVIATNVGNPNGDPPYMWAQQVGALSCIECFTANNSYLLSTPSVQAGQLSASDGSGAMLSSNGTTGEAPLVMTPAAADGDTWQLLPTTAGVMPEAPAMTTAWLSDWYQGQATATSSTPQWESSSQTVSAAQGGLTGPLADLYFGAAPTPDETAGQWMVAASGIASALLTPTFAGYDSSAETGIYTVEGKSGDDDEDEGLNFWSCPPGGSTGCMLPTWQTVAIDPYDQASPSTYLNTGLFDFNNGVVIANQHGQNGNPDATNQNPGTWLNQMPNWATAQNLRGVDFYGFLDALEGNVQGSLDAPSFSAAGRPVLFYRTQASNDCFYWNGTTSAAEGGVGCLLERTSSTQILPQ